jgi:hypothetical protein
MGVYRKHTGGVFSTIKSRQQSKMCFQQSLMLVSNEGFKSYSIKQSFFSNSSRMSQELSEDATYALSAWSSHTKQVVEISTQFHGLSPLQRFFWIGMQLLQKIQVGLMKIQSDNIRVICPHPQSKLKRSCLIIFICIWMIASLPLFALFAIYRFFRRM